ncbi:MAG TPA: hypothetical protein VNQ81_17300 [Povalibacter sp.]|nr:hypothetical protein [Povalibacter sp.]
MNRIFTALLTTFGLTAGAQSDLPGNSVGPNSLRFSMPTVAADDIEFIMPTKETFEGAPQFHEDEWCQLEFFQNSRLSEIQKLLSEYNTFEKKHRTEHGWNKIYARKLARSAVFEEGHGPNSVARILDARILPVPILTTTSRPLGQVQGGFTLALPGSVFLYVVSGVEGITALGALVQKGGDDAQLIKAFVSLSNRYHLILVDWRAQQILVSATNTGQINVWRP